MADVLFYHLTQSPVEAALPPILAKTLERGWRALVRGTDGGRLRRLDEVLWTRSDSDFLPHGLAGGDHDAAQPVLLSDSGDNANGAQVLVLIDGARVDPSAASGFERICLMFDAQDEGQLNAARADWKAVSGAGLPAQYWAQDGGRWVKKAEAGQTGG